MGADKALCDEDGKPVAKGVPARCDVEFDDLMSAAYIAMREAASTYKAERGAFTTWYSITLKRLMRRCTASGRAERRTTR